MDLSEKLLPADIISRATLRGNEFAWPVSDIPAVIEAAKLENLVNIGGQLQFRIPNGGTCECYWVDVDTYKTVPTDLPWADRVSCTASTAIAEFQQLCDKYDFVAEGRSAFAAHLEEFEAQGGDINEALCFVWYVEAETGGGGRHR